MTDNVQCYHFYFSMLYMFLWTLLEIGNTLNDVDL